MAHKLLKKKIIQLLRNCQYIITDIVLLNSDKKTVRKIKNIRNPHGTTFYLEIVRNRFNNSNFPSQFKMNILANSVRKSAKTSEFYLNLWSENTSTIHITFGQEPNRIRIRNRKFHENEMQIAFIIGLRLNFPPKKI